MAAIALTRMHHLHRRQAITGIKQSRRWRHSRECAEQFGIFAATYGIAVLHFLESPVQVVMIEGEDDATADQL